MKVRVLKKNPDIVTIQNFFSLEECNEVMRLAYNRLVPSLTVHNESGGNQMHPERISEGMNFLKRENEFISGLEERVASIVGVSVLNLENLSVFRYKEGGKYSPHYDFFDPMHLGTPNLLKRGGQRVATLIVYLKAASSGGGTTFPNVNVQVTSVAGTALFFRYPNLEKSTLHGGDPVLSGTKWILTAWIRESMFV